MKPLQERSGGAPTAETGKRGKAGRVFSCGRKSIIESRAATDDDEAVSIVRLMHGAGSRSSGGRTRNQSECKTESRSSEKSQKGKWLVLGEAERIPSFRFTGIGKEGVPDSTAMLVRRGQGSSYGKMIQRTQERISLAQLRIIRVL